MPAVHVADQLIFDANLGQEGILNQPHPGHDIFMKNSGERNIRDETQMN